LKFAWWFGCPVGFGPKAWLGGGWTVWARRDDWRGVDVPRFR
jgi:hypothetical protein